MIHVLSQPPNDEFTLRLFFSLLNDLDIKKITYDAFYVWSMQLMLGREIIDYFGIKNYDYDRKYFTRHSPDSSPRLSYQFYWDFINNNSNNDLIILGIKDNLNIGNFNPWIDADPSLISHLNKIFENHKNKKIILLTSLVNLENYITYKNVKVIHWGGDITNQYTEYSIPYIPINKNFNSQKTFLFLNRGMRPHRLHTLSYIFYKNLEEFGILSCMYQKTLTKNTFNNTEWQFSTQDFDIFLNGQEKIINYKFEINDDIEIYETKPNDNYFNLNKKLKKYYQNCFIEIIPETLYGEEASLITEKTHHCILEMCFPIWISSPGTVKYLRDIGLDVFDDIIDHSYDEINHPIERIKFAINDNIDLLKNIEKVKLLWILNQHRFKKNIEFIQQDFYNLIKDNVKNEFYKSI